MSTIIHQTWKESKMRTASHGCMKLKHSSFLQPGTSRAQPWMSMYVYNCQIKTPTSEPNSNYMIHVHAEIVVAVGKNVDTLTKPESDWIGSQTRSQIGSPTAKKKRFEK